MIHAIRTEIQRQYKYTGTNQHGDRYKIKGRKNIRVLTLSVEYDNDKEQIWGFMAMCSSLGIPPTWKEIDGKQRMSIEVVAKSSVM